MSCKEEYLVMFLIAFIEPHPLECSILQLHTLFVSFCLDSCWSSTAFESQPLLLLCLSLLVHLSCWSSTAFESHPLLLLCLSLLVHFSQFAHRQCQSCWPGEWLYVYTDWLHVYRKIVLAPQTRPSCAIALPQELRHWFCSQNLRLSSGIAFRSDCQTTRG